MIRNRAEWHRRAAEAAEAGHQMDYAAHEYFQACACFAAEGRRREATEMRRRERLVLSKTARLLDSARSLAVQGRSLASRASAVARHDMANCDQEAADLYN